MKNFGDFFNSYIDMTGFPPQIASGEVKTMQIDSANRTLTVKLGISSLVEREILVPAGRAGLLRVRRFG